MPRKTGTNQILPPVSVKTRILLSFLMVILVLSISIALLGYWVIQKDIIERADRKVRHDLTTARTVYTAEIERIGQALRLVSPNGNIEALKEKLNVHYLRYVTREDFDSLSQRDRQGGRARRASPSGAPGSSRPTSLRRCGRFPGQDARSRSSRRPRPGRPTGKWSTRSWPRNTPYRYSMTGERSQAFCTAAVRSTATTRSWITSARWSSAATCTRTSPSAP